jgi:hypothetical protein
MAIASNLYASKVFSEHPIASWSLDDDVSYISLITESQRDLANWTELVNATESEVIGMQGSPFEDSILTEITAINPNLVIEAFSEDLFNLQDLNQAMNTFAINLFLYTDGSVLYYEYGYRYIDPYSAEYIENVQRVEDSRFSTWIRVGSTFNPPNLNTQAQIVFRAAFSSGSSASIILNGLSVGQWAEPTSNVSLGVTPQLVDANLQSILGPVYGVATQAYGLSSNDGYILVEDGRLLAINRGIPMVYGSDNVTRLSSSETLPSVVIPGMGMLNESGKYNSYTMEMWLKIENNHAISRRIWGPLSSNDGLHIKRGYLSLVIGNSIGSYFVSDWYRPMIVHIVVRENSASVLINGEEVISIDFDTSSLILPDITEDWIGFYCHHEMPIFELDCISILPYVIPAQVAKRRFVWGQGVESPETINSAYEGTVAYIDYPYSEYTVNQTYPDFARWDAAYSENLSTTRRSVSVPDYKLPDIFIGEKTLQDFYDDNYSIQEVGHPRFMSFRPNNTWTDPCYYYFNSLNILTDVVRAVWGVFEVETPTATSEPLMHFYNSITGDSFNIDIDGLDVTYNLYRRNSITPQTFKTETIDIDSHFVVGFDLPRLFSSFGSQVGEFFGNPSAIQIKVGGDGSTTFSGWIYRVGFSNQTNLEKIQNHFDNNGIAIASDIELLNDHLASYTLLPTEDFNLYYLDIGVSSYWEEYYPLSYFAGSIKDSYGNQFYDLDFIQYNIGYPTTTVLVEDDVVGSWSYEELAEAYSTPTVKPYDVLDNALISGYDDYDELKNKTVTIKSYDFSESSLRSYITFQKISDGSNRPISDYPQSQSIPETNVLDVPSFANQFSTKFEIIDQSVIYPPKTFGIENTAIVIHLEANIYGVKTNPLNIRKMSLSSKSLDPSAFNHIGTRFGNKLYPYSKTGIYYDNSKQNPYSIYKDSSPYLYLTKHSGIESLGEREFQVERGISMPINSEKKNGDKVSAIQLWIKYNGDTFTQSPTTLFSLDSASLDLGFNVISDQSATRGRLFSTNLITGQEYVDLTFYQDGIEVITPYLEKNKWTSIGINFGTPIGFSNYTGSINLFQSATFNDIAYYKATSLQEAQSVIYRRWDNVNGVPLSPLDWQYWIGNTDPYGKWDNVLKLAEKNIYGVSPETLYKSYTGTNRQVVDDGEVLMISETGVTILSSSMTDETYSSTYPTKTRMVVGNSPEWSSYNKKPV